MSKTEKYYANGKLLISGEYLALKGALALAAATKHKQFLYYDNNASNIIYWKSFDNDECLWFEGEFSSLNYNVIKSSNKEIGLKLSALLKAAFELSDKNKVISGIITTQLDFSRFWGLGTSSTLSSLIAQLFDIKAMELHFKTSNGSGYDVACANINSAIIYKLLDKNKTSIVPVFWNPSFKNNIFFVYLNKKQNSSIQVNDFIEKTSNVELHNQITSISNISKNILECKSLKEFESLIAKHEEILSLILKTKTIKDKLFKDYVGAIKSLGSWGGDFVLATGNIYSREYFKEKGYNTILEFDELIL
jgi:mevalonate kinase